jgi:hypothetical protein
MLRSASTATATAAAWSTTRRGDFADKVGVISARHLGTNQGRDVRRRREVDELFMTDPVLRAQA